MAEQKKIRLLLADDSQVILDGLKFNFQIENDFELIGEAHHEREIMDILMHDIPNVLLLDLTLEKEGDGILVLKKIQSLYPEIKVIIFSHQKDVFSIVNSIQSGAHAYLSKDSRIEEIISSIRIVDGGRGIFLGETIPKEILTNCFRGQARRENFKPYNLSEREIEVIAWLSKGYISKEIAEILRITTTTVETHKENIKLKLGLKTMIEIVVFAIKNDLISYQ